MSKDKLMAKKQSNIEHHLSFWESDYKEYARKIALDIFALAELNKRFHEYEYRMKVIDQNRRENAVAMGVSIKESDEKYSFEAELKTIPKIIEGMLEYEKKFGIRYGDIRKLNQPKGQNDE